MFASVLTIVRTPSRERRRLTAPMRTPSAVESRNVVSVRSTTMRVRPDSSASPRAALSSGAVNRSISPPTATTWRVSSIGSLLRENSGGIGSLRLTDLPAVRRARRPACESRPEAQPQDQFGRLALGAQLADAQLEVLVVGGDHDADMAVARVDRCVRGDRVGEQDGVVEPVDRALGAGGEHADD